MATGSRFVAKLRVSSRIENGCGHLTRALFNVTTVANAHATSAPFACPALVFAFANAFRTSTRFTLMSGAPLPEEAVYDVIIVGTGLPESVLSAALSIAGKRVLHLDPNPFYGLRHASVRLERLHDILLDPDFAPEARDHQELADQNKEGVSAAPCDHNAIKLPLRLQRAREGTYPVGARVSPKGKFEFASKVTIDLAPRCLLAAGSMINLLAQTGAGHYVSFRPLDATFLRFQQGTASGELSGTLEKVPASRSDVFQSQFLSMVEKRLLMRFLSSASPSDPKVNSAGGEIRFSHLQLRNIFEEQMESAGLTEKLRQFVRHAIVFAEQAEIRTGVSSDTLSVQAGFDQIRTYLQSLTRFGTPTPFLYPNYGCGELAEALCRLSAVHGGTFALRRNIKGFYSTGTSANSRIAESTSTDVESARCALLTSDGEHLQASFIFISSALIIPNAACTSDARAEIISWRFAGVLSGSVFGEDTPRALAVFPKMSCGNSNSCVHVLQLNSSAQVCPDGAYILYAETVGVAGSDVDLISVIDSMADLREHREILLPTSTKDEDYTVHRNNENCIRPRVLWSMLYPVTSVSRQPGCRPVDGGIPPGYCNVRNIPNEYDGTETLAEARRCFQMVCPVDSFFPEQGQSSASKNGSADVA
jgi:Rab proteins geranylgeranyltransferase component A